MIRFSFDISLMTSRLKQNIGFDAYNISVHGENIGFGLVKHQVLVKNVGIYCFVKGTLVIKTYTENNFMINL